MWVMQNLTCFHLETVLVSVQDRCMVCAKCTTGMEILFGIPDGTLGDLGEMEANWSLFGDSVNLNAR